MSNVSFPTKGYVLAGVLGAITGGLVVALATKAIPKMMSQMMAGMMQKMMGPSLGRLKWLHLSIRDAATRMMAGFSEAKHQDVQKSKTITAP
jgi:fructose-specific phosphotransferase system IIC component